MTAPELKNWMDKYGIDEVELAQFLGVTRMAVRHWLSNKRSLSLAMSRLLKYFDRNPEAMRSYGK